MVRSSDDVAGSRTLPTPRKKLRHGGDGGMERIRREGAVGGPVIGAKSQL